MLKRTPKTQDEEHKTNGGTFLLLRCTSFVHVHLCEQIAKPLFVKIVPVGLEEREEHVNKDLGIFVGWKMVENGVKHRIVLFLGKTA